MFKMLIRLKLNSFKNYSYYLSNTFSNLLLFSKVNYSTIEPVAIACGDNPKMKLILRSGHLAKLADSSATGSINETHVLTTIVESKKKPQNGAQSFVPLTVDYFQKASASGRIPTTYARRDNGVSNNEVLVSRIIDRSIRPLFPQTTSNEVQIICNLLSFDGQQNPDVVCVNTVSYALHRSHIPWNGPIGCVRVGMNSVGNFIINPTRKELESSPVNLLITTNSKSEIVMLEGWADNIPQNTFIQAIQHGVIHSDRIVQFIKNAVNKPPVDSTVKPKKIYDFTECFEDKNYFDEIKKSVSKKLSDIYEDITHDKKSRDNAIFGLRDSTIWQMKRDSNETFKDYEAFNWYSQLQKDIFRDYMYEGSIRCDGRGVDDVRPITCETGLFPNLHGSALFQRGQTQVLCTLTFDSADTMYKNDRIIDMVSPSLTKFDKNFMLHYEFPPYATNEIGRASGPANRREIGHGALAEKSIYPVVPPETPYTIRLLCEVLESNGSSSMASVSAGSLALLDAGVEITEPVCGVAMGLVTRKNENNEITGHRVLTDISGLEDYLGDMDFKIAGTRSGITAIQADVKLEGVSPEIIYEALEKSLIARGHILDKMAKVISKPNLKKTDQRPVTKVIEVPMHKRGKLVGIGGINIKRVESETGVKFTTVDETKFSIFAPSPQAFAEAEKLVNKFLEEQREPVLEFNNVYTAKVVEIVESGVKVQLFEKMQPVLLPNSQLDLKRIEHGSASGLKVGEEIQVKYFGRDPTTGAMRLSRKVLFLTSYKPSRLFSKIDKSDGMVELLK